MAEDELVDLARNTISPVQISKKHRVTPIWIVTKMSKSEQILRNVAKKKNNSMIINITKFQFKPQIQNSITNRQNLNTNPLKN
jgi:hypothetical protein